MARARSPGFVPYFARVRALGDGIESPYSPVTSFFVGILGTVVDDAQGTIAEFRLNQTYPNPFNPLTTIRYGLPHKSVVQLTVFNTLGQQVAQLVNGEIDAGDHEVQFNASNLASGVYFYRFQARDFVQTRKLVLAK